MLGLCVRVLYPVADLVFFGLLLFQIFSHLFCFVSVSALARYTPVSSVSAPSEVKVFKK